MRRRGRRRARRAPRLARRRHRGRGRRSRARARHGERARVPRPVHPPRVLRVRRGRPRADSSPQFGPEVAGTHARRAGPRSTSRPRCASRWSVPVSTSSTTAASCTVAHARLLLTPARRRNRPPGDGRGAAVSVAGAPRRGAGAHRRRGARRADAIPPRSRSSLVTKESALDPIERRSRRARPTSARTAPRSWFRRPRRSRRRRPAPRWHFIGRLQRNKVDALAPHVALWQSVDRDELADEIARHAPGAAVLVQVNVAGEAQKGGCAARRRARALVDALPRPRASRRGPDDGAAAGADPAPAFRGHCDTDRRRSVSASARWE